MKKKILALLALTLTLSLSGCNLGDVPNSSNDTPVYNDSNVSDDTSENIGDTSENSSEGIENTSGGIGGTSDTSGVGTLQNIDTPYVEVNGNVPTFTQDEITTESYEFYSELDELGRCGVAHACQQKIENKLDR